MKKNIKQLFFFKFFVLFSSLLLLFNSQCFCYELVICSMFKNEGRFLEEWIEYHKNIGVDHFYLFDDESSDDSLSCLRPFIKDGLVTLFSARKLFPNKNTWEIQPLSNNYILEKYGKDTEWCAYIDIDEFLVPLIHDNMKDFLADFPNEIGSIYVKWQCFGTSNIYKVPENKLLESLKMKSIPADPLNSSGKSIVRTSSIIGMNNPHFASLKPEFSQELCSPNLAQINHYFCRDQLFFYSVRVRSRRNPAFFKEGISNKQIEDRSNLVFDDSIIRLLEINK